MTDILVWIYVSVAIVPSIVIGGIIVVQMHIHQKEREQLHELIMAKSLSEYKGIKQPIGKSGNWLHDNITKPKYHHKDDEPDEE